MTSRTTKKCPKGQYLKKGYIRKAYCTAEGKCYPEAKVSPSCITIRDICPSGHILRLGYTRKAHTRTTKTGKKVRVAVKKVEPTCIQDVGKKGRAPKLIKLRKDISLRYFNYSTKNPEIERRKSLKKVADTHGPGPVIVRLNKLSILNSRRPKTAQKFLDDIKYVQKTFNYHKLF